MTYKMEINAKALLLVLTGGRSIAAVSLQFGISKAKLTLWLHEAHARMATDKSFLVTLAELAELQEEYSSVLAELFEARNEHVRRSSWSTGDNQDCE